MRHRSPRNSGFCYVYFLLLLWLSGFCFGTFTKKGLSYRKRFLSFAAYIKDCSLVDGWS